MGGMEARIAEFAELLRHNGLKVSIAEVLDAVRASALLGVADRNTFRAALACSLVKRAADEGTFARVFELYFTGAAATLDAIDASIVRQLTEAGLLEGDELKMVVATLAELAGNLSPLARAVVEGDRGALARLFRGAALQLDFSRMESQFQQGFYARRLLSGAGSAQASRDLDSIGSELRKRGLAPQGVETVSRHLSAAMRQVEQAAREEVDRSVQARVPRLRASAQGEQRFSTLSREELSRAQTSVRRLAERLKSRLVRRERTRRKGVLNVRRTLRKNLGWGGIPARLSYRSRRPQRPDVVVLCDVSDSVRNVSRVMLLFVHTLQSLFHRVRSFVFVSDVGEVTQLFRDAEVGEAVELAVAGRAVSLHANSNYGHALATFARSHLGAVSRKTTFLVIGDGRNNFNPPSVWALEEIKRKARRLIWICPEERYAFGTGDSEMLAYARVCHQVATVQSLDDLEKVADALVPRR
jgi:uncharacterized protein with von Willebrand factor type A (vWA) domain